MKRLAATCLLILATTSLAGALADVRLYRGPLSEREIADLQKAP